MNIDSIKNGIVIDHIRSGGAMQIYTLLNLEALDCQIAIIKNAVSAKMGKKDIIKIDSKIELDLMTLGYLDPNITVNVISDGTIVEKFHPTLPDRMVNVISCKNPRCITSVETQLDQIFELADRENRIYRCIYCETKAENNI